MIRLFEPGFFEKSPSVPATGTTDQCPVTPLNDQNRRRLLAEAFSWCQSQELIANPEETPDIRRRRALFKESCSLSWKAYQVGEEYPDGPNRKRARELLEEANPNSLVLLRKQLRSSELLPEAVYSSLSADTFAEAFSLVISNRRDCLERTGIEVLSPPTKEHGRLLNYWPDENLADGAAEYSSNGFFDTDNVPPWDTWVSFDDRTLICWIPRVLVPLAQAGIDANPEACIDWVK